MFRFLFFERSIVIPLSGSIFEVPVLIVTYSWSFRRCARTDRGQRKSFAFFVCEFPISCRYIIQMNEIRSVCQRSVFNLIRVIKKKPFSRTRVDIFGLPDRVFDPRRAFFNSSQYTVFLPVSAVRSNIFQYLYKR